MDASHFKPGMAFAAINRIRCDDLRPHILRTEDFGKHWTEIVDGLPANEPINVVREDPQQPGLLYAGSECAVYFSIDNGAHWQSLRRNMPATSIRDLVIKDDDLVVGTHGRSFWILDNISALRQLAALKARDRDKSRAILFKPQTAIRVRWNMNTDTPLPPEEPAGENPPEGAMIDYYLPKTVQGPLVLEILDVNGQVIRHYSSADRAPAIDRQNFPEYWVRNPAILSEKAGMHRFCWDMRYDPVNTNARFSIAAVYRNTAPESDAPWVMPGEYQVRLNVDGQTFLQAITVQMDPRVNTSRLDLQNQHDLSLLCHRDREGLKIALENRRILQQQMDRMHTNNALSGNARQDLDSLLVRMDKRLQSFAVLASLDGRLAQLVQLIQESDLPPTLTMQTGAEQQHQLFQQRWVEWNRFLSDELPGFNTAIQKFGFSAISPNPAPEREHAAITKQHPLFASDLSNAVFSEGIWSVQQGELTATEDQCIFTKQTYQNFVLDLEFKTADGTNSGVIVHCSNTTDWIPNSVEIQIADDYAEQWAKAPGTWQCGAVFGHLAPAKSLVKKPGAWNHFRITCKDREIWVELNGETINYMDMNRWVSGSENPDGSKIPSWLYKPFATLPLEGHIGFQGKHAGAPIWFRNITITELE